MSTPPTKYVWKVKSVSDLVQEEVQPMAPFEPSDVP